MSDEAGGCGNQPVFPWSMSDINRAAGAEQVLVGIYSHAIRAKVSTRSLGMSRVYISERVKHPALCSDFRVVPIKEV